MKRTLSAGLLLATALATLWLVPGAASAASGACTSDQDVTVLVQFPDRTETGCATGDPGTGVEALEQAGFPVVIAQGSGAGAVCRIDGYPGNNNCGRMPPANAYWAYFQGDPGGGWTYSTEGAGTRRPSPGEVEGWRFGSGSAPTSTPPQAPRPTPVTPPRATPKPTPRATAGATSRATPRPGSGGGSQLEPGTSGGTAQPTASGTATLTGTTAPTAPAAATGTATAIPSAGVSPTPTAGTVASASGGVDDAAPAAKSSGGLSWIWGLVLLVVLAGAGGVVAVRRRG